MYQSVTANEFYNRVFDSKNQSEAAEELYNLVSNLLDDVEFCDLLGKVDSYVDDLSREAQEHYKTCIRA